MSISEKEVLDFLYKKKKTLEEELVKVNQAIEALDGSARSFHVRHEREDKKIPIPAKYEKRLKIDIKIAYILSLIKKGNKEEIINKIIEFEPDYEEEKLKSNVAVRLSFLLKNNYIKATKTGRSYDYFLPF